MAHQCWNDGTDRSTLPIHGTWFIGYLAATPVAVSRRRPIFFVFQLVRFASKTWGQNAASDQLASQASHALLSSHHSAGAGPQLPEETRRMLKHPPVEHPVLPHPRWPFQERSSFGLQRFLNPFQTLTLQALLRQYW